MTLPPLDSEALRAAAIELANDDGGSWRALPEGAQGAYLKLADAVIRAYLGALPRSPLPTEPSEAAIQAALNVLECESHPKRPGATEQDNAWYGTPTHYDDLQLIRRVLERAYAAERESGKDAGPALHNKEQK